MPQSEIKTEETQPLTEAPEDRFPVVCYDNRELSWLKFDMRCLEEAMDRVNNPLCERLSFASIFQSNLDEFFMVRAGTMFDQRKTNIRDNKTGMTCQEQLDAILAKAKGMLREKDRVYAALAEELKAEGVEILPYSALNDKEKRGMEKYFTYEVQPLLSPQIISPKQPFPFLQNKEIYAVISLCTKNSNQRMGIVPCSSRVLPRLITVSNGRYILLEDLILHFAPRIFERYRVVHKALVRIVRNADITIDSMVSEFGAGRKDYRKIMEKMLRRRRKLCPIKMEYQGSLDAATMLELLHYLGLSKKHVFKSAAPLELSFLFEIQDSLRGRKELFFNRRNPQHAPGIAHDVPMIDQILDHDIFLTYPYESIRPFVRLLNEAANDPKVASIRMTLYRVAKNSQIVEALCQAAENGKDVLVLVELRARFDEENNIGWSRVLEDAGCRIIYGLDGIKIHSKLCLITRKNGDEVEYISQIGTGNYNEKTAKLYTDLSLLTSSREIGIEAVKVFNCLSMGQVVENMQHLLVAPHCLRNRLIDFIDEEIAKAKAGQSAYIGVKTNSLTDRKLIDKLIEASQAGVKIELLVRGICCLVAGIPEYTHNIRVQSIVGRYLEHSRIYIFGAQGEEQRVYIASADFMTRNTSRRVEVGAPIYDKAIKERCLWMFHTAMADNVKARVQQSDGTYQKKTLAEGEKPLNSQEYFFECAYRAMGTPLPESVVMEEPAVVPAAPAAEVVEAKAEAPAEAVVQVAAPAEKAEPVKAEPAAEPIVVEPIKVVEAPAAEKTLPAEETKKPQGSIFSRIRKRLFGR